MRKARFYLPAILQHLLVPNLFYRSRLKKILQQVNEVEAEGILQRVKKYIKLNSCFKVTEEGKDLANLHYRDNSSYYYDLRSIIRYFPEKLRFYHRFGDIKCTFDSPTFVKCRPLGLVNNNSVVLKLNSVRHFRKINDNIPYTKKSPALVWRGQVFNSMRQNLVSKYFDHPQCDIGQVNEVSTGLPKGLKKNKMSISEQLKYKFILSVEGNDVATNLKWISQSNSLCFMPKVKHESWFMENDLRPNFHYVEVKDNFSDIPDKIDYYLKNEDQAEFIINNLNNHYKIFTNERTELITSILTVGKYFELSNQFYLSDYLPSILDV